MEEIIVYTLIGSNIALVATFIYHQIKLENSAQKKRRKKATTT